MTKGVDLSASQTGLNYDEVVRQGFTFAIVKAAGLNTGSFYQAGGYVDHMKNVRSRFRVGHYYMIGNPDWSSPRDQARDLVSNLYDYRPGDVIALDNEKLDKNKDGKLFSVSQIEEFYDSLQTNLGTRVDRFWVYGNRYDLASAGNLNTLTDRGMKIWLANYSGRAYSYLGGKLNFTPTVHQYTETGNISGRMVDFNETEKSLDELFGGLHECVA